MLNKDKLLSHIQLDNERLKLAQIVDKVQWVIKNHQQLATDFIDPSLAILAKDILTGIDKIGFVLDGGFPTSERQCFIIFPDYLADDDVETDLAFIEVKGNFKFTQVNHRDFLGSILALGIKREKVGDILVTNNERLVDGCQVIVKDEIADYLCANLTKIQRVAVKTNLIPQERIQIDENKYKEIFTTVASLRIDAIASSGFGVSRSQIVKEIQGGKLKVNWRETTNSSAQVGEGDVISIRGRGRLEVVEIIGKSNKDRIKLLLKRFV